MSVLLITFLYFNLKKKKKELVKKLALNML